MPILCLCALAGAYALQFLSQLPDRPLLVACVPVSLMLLCFACSRAAGVFVLGFLIAAFDAQALIDDRLPPAFSGRSMMITARIADFPRVHDAGVSLLAEPIGRDDLPARIRLSWFDAQTKPALGETWELTVRLRRPRGFANPGGFDYEAWLFREGIGASGYVVGSAGVRRTAEVADRIARIRSRAVARIESSLPHDDAAAVVMAIAVGARHKITREQWTRYAMTGTSHLMAISGLHIGLAAGSAFLASWLLLAPLCLRLNVRDSAAFIAAVVAYAYAAISGFAVPAQRAFMMTALVLLAALVRRPMPPSRLLAICCFAILLSDSTSILKPGFKLSFAAVAILFWNLKLSRHTSTGERGRCVTAIRQAVRRLASMQMALLLGLTPLTALLFDRIAVLAPVVNLLVLPVFNLVSVPACLLGMLLDGPFEAAGNLSLSLAHASVAGALELVQLAAALPGAHVSLARPRGLWIVVTLLPCLWTLLPPAWPGRQLALLALVSLGLYRPPGPPQACLDLHVLDVGQGLALVMRTHRHVAVFDAGPAFRAGSDAGDWVVAPFLKGEGIAKIDLLIVSHADQDHAGGLKSLVSSLALSDLIGGEALRDVDSPQGACRAADNWRWDGVEFMLLHPNEPGVWHGNNASCVLEIRIGERRVLLTGDIEAPVEKMLVHQGVLQPTDIVLIPHHGSDTSSSPGFVGALRPEIAIVSAGKDNRWGFPKPRVVSRWRRAGAQVLNTAAAGAVSHRICRDGVRQVALHRLHNRRYWHDSH